MPGITMAMWASRRAMDDGSASVLASLEEALRRDVCFLAREIGERNAGHPAALEEAARYIERRWRSAGLAPVRQSFRAAGQVVANVEVEIPGTAPGRGTVLVGAHYDSVPGSPGANGNASAVAGLLHLAERFAGHRLMRSLRLVAFANKEPPFTRTREMGSRVYAREARRAGLPLHVMVCLETIGYRDTRQGSQRLSLGGLLLPSQGDFLAIIGNWRHRRWLARAAAGFGERCAIATRTLVLPSHLPGAWSSDHWSFWKEGFPALMLTDTAPLRYPWYHTPDDTPEKVDYAFLAQVLAGVEGVLERFLGEAP